MPNRFVVVPPLELDELLLHHNDVVASLRLYFNPSAPGFAARFAGKRLDEVAQELALRLDESDARSAFFVLTSLEARFRADFDFRCKQRLKDELSVYFRSVGKERDAVRLDEDIFEGWKRHGSAPSGLISELRGAFKFRHWLAHGRYWIPKLGRRYDFDFVHLIADAIVSDFQFEG
jgi:hypothetical protein